nr:unnamed protein product [Callosobruchus analis]
MESHYCRKSTTREYLYADLTVRKMFSLYEEENAGKDTMCSYHTYRRVFESLNLSFHHPKKGQCSLCMAYRQGTDEQKRVIETVFVEHTNKKKLQEQLFNESQIRIRNSIERKFGQWKRRFPIVAFGIRLKVEKVEAVVIATAVLDNIAKLLNEVDLPINEEDEAAITLVANINEHPDMNIYNMHDENNIVRHQLINYFNGLALA